MRGLWAAGAAIVMCLALAGVQVTVTQECAGRGICIWTASDPRLPDTLATDISTGFVEVEGAGELDAGFAWMDVGFEGPEGGWTGYVYALWGEPTHNFLVPSGIPERVQGDPQRGDEARTRSRHRAHPRREWKSTAD
jgi:hypothetical protein